MTLYEITRTIEALMKDQPNCGTIIRNDVYRLNETPSAQYPVMAWGQRDHSLSGDRVDFAFTLYYIERLTADADNEVIAQSTAISALTNIVKGLRETDSVSVSGVTYSTFIQKFKDLTAGAYCRVTISVPLTSVCVTDYTSL